MKQMKYLVVALGLLAAGSIVFLAWRSFHSGTPRAEARAASLQSSASSANDAELVALREQVGRLESQIQGVHSNLRAANAVEPPAAVAPTAPVSREEAEQRWLDHMRDVDTLFQREPIDPKFAADMSAKIHAAANAAETAGLVLDVECRSRSCRVDLGDATTAKLERATQHLIHSLASDLQNASVGHNGDPSDPKPSSLYLARARPEDSIPLVARQ